MTTLQNTTIENDKPTAADIELAIRNAEAGNWLDPSRTPHYWNCFMRHPDGRTTDGQAHSAGQAMAMAWLAWWAPSVARYDIPREVGDWWQFRLTPPQQTRAWLIAWIHEHVQEFDDETDIAGGPR